MPNAFFFLCLDFCCVLSSRGHCSVAGTCIEVLGAPCLLDKWGRQRWQKHLVKYIIFKVIARKWLCGITVMMLSGDLFKWRVWRWTIKWLRIWVSKTSSHHVLPSRRRLCTDPSYLTELTEKRITSILGRVFSLKITFNSQESLPGGNCFQSPCAHTWRLRPLCPLTSGWSLALCTFRMPDSAEEVSAWYFIMLPCALMSTVVTLSVITSMYLPSWLWIVQNWRRTCLVGSELSKPFSIHLK